SCTGVGLVCSALDAYTDVQVATLSGSGEIDIDATGGTLQFVQDGTQDVGSGPQPSYVQVDASDLTFAEIPLVGAPMTQNGVVFALSNPLFEAGGQITPGSYPLSTVVSYSGIADIVGPVNAWIPEVLVTPQDVTVDGTLVVLALLATDEIYYRIENLTATMVVSNPTTLLGESVTVTVTAEMALNLVGNTFEGLPIPGLGGSGLLLLVAGLAVTGVASVRTFA
ncbi:MAG: hypothetical protein VX466_14440, partial [Myxococcota bacterium]|nr:hypothetical protein [Myxococcota bacterium]